MDQTISLYNNVTKMYTLFDILNKTTILLEMQLLKFVALFDFFEDIHNFSLLRIKHNLVI